MTGPFRDADNRPLVKTRLKYEVVIETPEEVFDTPPSAQDALDKRVSMTMDDVIENVRKQIADVILATQNFSHPNRAEVIHTELEEFEPNNLVSEGHVNIHWIYTVEGVGIGESAETRVFASQVADMQKVLVEGNNTPIQNNTQIRNFDSGPLNVKKLIITTE